jgi:ATP-dependent Lhr-like helicase
VFLSPPLFAVLHGRREVGFVDELTFLGKHEGPRVLLLGGRAWRVTHIDWQRKVAHVEASEDRGRTRWKGECRGFSFQLCQAIKRVLSGDDHRDPWSRRATEQMSKVRQDYVWLCENSTVVVTGPNETVRWWTFAGAGANAALADALAQLMHSRVEHDSFTLSFESHLPTNDIEHALAQLRDQDVREMLPEVDERAVEGLKFSECLPPAFATMMLQRRSCDPAGAREVLGQRIRFVSAVDNER